MAQAPHRQYRHHCQKYIRLLTLTLSIFLMSSLLLVSPTIAIAAPLTLPIDQARQQPDGRVVVTTGVVSVPSGRFESALLDQGFAIQDDSGGIYVSTDNNIGLQLGSTVEITGMLQEDGHGQQILHLEHWRLQDQTPRIVCPQKASVQIATSQLQGKLVQIYGIITKPLVDDTPYGDRLWITDDTGTVQIYMPRSTSITPQKRLFLQPGQAIQVTGFSSQYNHHQEVIPRSIEDIRPFPYALSSQAPECTAIPCCFAQVARSAKARSR